VIRARLFALLDFQVYESLAGAGLEPVAAADEITTTILARLRAKGSRR